MEKITHYFVVKIVSFVWKRPKIREKEYGRSIRQKSLKTGTRFVKIKAARCRECAEVISQKKSGRSKMLVKWMPRKAVQLYLVSLKINCLFQIFVA